MTRAVWKYVLRPELNRIEAPYGAQFLYAAGQGDDAVVVYALIPDVDNHHPLTKTYRLFVASTGDALPAGDLLPLGVASLSGGALMFHVFEVLP